MDVRACLDVDQPDMVGLVRPANTALRAHANVVGSAYDSVIFLLLLIARSKLVPDFALTIHFLHLLVTTLYTRSLPSYGFWWALQIASATLMTSLGVWSCRYRELQPIQIGTGRKPSTISHPTARKLGMNGQDSSRLREEVTPLTAADPESYEMA